MMKITIIQFASRLGDVDCNYAAAAERMEAAVQADKPDVVVLPEMWNTGFYPDDVLRAADEGGVRTQAFLSAFAAAHEVNIVGGSVAVQENGKAYNRMYVYNRGGSLTATYDKAHLFSPAGEDKKFTPGNAPGLFSLDGVNMGAVICYDLRFCEWVRLTVLAGAQVLFIPASWPAARIDHWHLLGRARAVENQCYVVMANAVDDVKGKIGGGGSAVFGPLGETSAKGGDAEDIIEATIEPVETGRVRQKITVFADRRPALYEKAAAGKNTV
ncbi:carbon-nitrogen family hydrolase [Megasphaera coli]|uniref:carbon-nitrogen family hydrolase n=1 Tax=Colibacter massiliensis TaxID=1852379 RepID=UPI00196894BB|nr:carbon-nitrogen family hydrolase [Colibacter massiliensis]